MTLAPPTSYDKRPIWLLVAATFVVLLNETTMTVALRPIMLSLHVDARTGQWLSTAFMLTMAVVIPTTGFLLQRLSSRTAYVTALTLFCTGTLIAALAPVFGILLVGRVVQAGGTAIMMPFLMTSLMTLVPPGERGRMMGNVSTVIAVAPATGPMLSGVLLDTVGWRGIFWFMLPFGLGMLWYGARTIGPISQPRSAPLDIASVILSALGFGGLVYGLSLVGSTEPGSQVTLAACLVVGVIALFLFGWRQLRLQRGDRALLDLRTFSHTQFSVGLAILAVGMAALFGVVIIVPLYLMGVLAMDPLRVGLLLVPGGLVMGLLGQVTGRLYDRVGPRPLVLPATVVVALVMVALTQIGEGTSPWALLVGHLVLSVALSFMFTPLFTSSLAAVPMRLYSHASAILGTVQQVAGAAGTAVFITIMSARAGVLAEQGATPAAALAGGVRAAFVVGAVLSVVPIGLALLVRRADPEPVELPTGTANEHAADVAEVQPPAETDRFAEPNQPLPSFDPPTPVDSQYSASDEVEASSGGAEP